ncbi:MAG: DUF4394 domain-containing protein [Armatimonadetes bacterium]|nr:DUF4394 domain-containing protein [Armatimonadota bacterium]
MKLALNLSAATLAVAALALSGSAANAQTAFTLDATGTSLISFSVATPNILTTVGVTGAILDAIDFNAQTGVLYGYSSTVDQVYTVTTAGVATPVTQTGTVATGTRNLGIDFNPTTGATVMGGPGISSTFRIVNENDQNLTFNTISGAYATQTPITFATTSPQNGLNPAAAENAYTNNLAGATSTQQYVIESGTNALYTLNNAGGILTPVGAGAGLGFNVTAGAVGFDIFTTAGGVNTAYAVLQNSGSSTLSSSLYEIDLSSGAATITSTIGGGTLSGLRGLAITPVVVPEAGTLPLVLGAFAALGAGVVVRRRK